MLLSLFQQITSETTLNSLAIHGLGMAVNVVDKHINFTNDITMSTFGVLKEWSKKHEGATVAHSLLCDALRHPRVGLNYLIGLSLRATDI